MESTTTLTEPAVEIIDLFHLDARIAPVEALPTVGRSANCTNDGCTRSCASCGCK